jgi:multiple antibiotic resistance protein
MIGPAEIFMIFFVMLGPLKVLGPFVERTRGLDEGTARQVAWWTFVIACVAIVIGGLLGRTMLTNWRVSVPALRLTGGIVFFLVALRQLLEQYQPATTAAQEPLPASPFAAASRLVFPMVLTPYGVAAVIALLAASPDTTRTATVLGLVLLVMLLDLAAMWVARRLLVGFAIVVLQILGAVLAVLQVALSVQIIVDALRALGVVAS